MMMMNCNRAVLAYFLASGMVTANADEVATSEDESGQGEAPAITLAPISVFGRQADDAVEDIPQTVTVYDQESFDTGSFDTVGDVLRLVPNASRAGSSRDMFADDYLFRGFNAEQSTNGLGFTRTDHPMDLVNVERIEVLKGPASVLYGQMEPGGTINVVTKQPLPYFHVEGGLEYGSNEHKRATLDVTGPITDRVRARLNLAYQDSDSSIDFLESERVFVAPNVTMDLSDSTNLTIEGSYSKNDWTALHGGAPIEGAIVDNPNGDYDKSFNPAFTDGFTERDSKYINVRLTQGITDTIRARASYTFLRNESDFREYGFFGLGDDFRTVDRIIFIGDDTRRDDHNLIVDVSGEIDTGPLGHKFIVGIDYREFDDDRPTQLFFVPPIDLYDPQYSAIDLDTQGMQVRDSTLRSDERTIAGFLQDRITVAERWHFLAGLRYIDSEQSQVRIDHLDDDAAEKDSLSQSDLTTQFGIVFDINEAASVYANRSESFVPQQGTTSGRDPLDAEEATQYEAGIRADIANLQFNAAIFQITKDNIAIEDPLDPDFEVAQGEARSRGAELSVGGYLSSNWYLSLAYGYNDTEILKSDDPELEGNRFANVPRHTASLQSRYWIDRVPGLSVGGTVSFVGDRFGDDENTFTLPNHTRVDLAAFYQMNDYLEVSFFVDNVLDEEIFSPGAFDGVIREPGRAYLATLKAFF